MSDVLKLVEYERLLLRNRTNLSNQVAPDSYVGPRLTRGALLRQTWSRRSFQLYLFWCQADFNLWPRLLSRARLVGARARRFQQEFFGRLRLDECRPADSLMERLPRPREDKELMPLHFSRRAQRTFF